MKIWTEEKKRPEGSEQRDKKSIHPLTESLLSEKRLRRSINRPCGWWEEHTLLRQFPYSSSSQTAGPHYTQANCSQWQRENICLLTVWWGLLKSLAWVQILDSWELWIHILHKEVHWFLLIWWWWGAGPCSQLWRSVWEWSLAPWLLSLTETETIRWGSLFYGITAQVYQSIKKM